MKRKLTLVLYVVAAALVSACSGETETIRFENPVIPEDRPDPTAVYSEADGCYYCYATGWNIPFYRSTDLVNWEKTDIRPFTEETVALLKTYGNSCWAPQFARIGDKYLLYLTIRSSCPDARIVVTASDSITGPYEFKGVLTDGLVTGIRDTIDPFVFSDEETGKVWLVFGSVGTIHQIELTADGMALKEGSEYRHIAGRDNQEDPSRLTVYEGSYVYRHDGWWYLFASAGRYNDFSYAVVVGRSRTPEGPYLGKDGRDMADGAGTVILSSSPYDHFYGPGHNGEIFTLRDGSTYMIYHVHVGDYVQDRLPGKYIPRPMNLQRIYWDNEGWPYFIHDEIVGGTVCR